MGGLLVVVVFGEEVAGWGEFDREDTGIVVFKLGAGAARTSPPRTTVAGGPGEASTGPNRGSARCGTHGARAKLATRRRR